MEKIEQSYLDSAIKTKVKINFSEIGSDFIWIKIGRPIETLTFNQTYLGIRNNTIFNNH